MTNRRDDTTQCFLVEWYQNGPVALSTADAAAHLAHAAATVSTHDQPVLLLVALTVPHDLTLFGVFSAATADAVVQTCQQAGWPADRISTDVHPWLCPGPRRLDTETEPSLRRRPDGKR